MTRFAATGLLLAVLAVAGLVWLVALRLTTRSLRRLVAEHCLPTVDPSLPRAIENPATAAALSRSLRTAWSLFALGPVALVIGAVGVGFVNGNHPPAGRIEPSWLRELLGSFPVLLAFGWFPLCIGASGIIRARRVQVMVTELPWSPAIVDFSTYLRVRAGRRSWWCELEVEGAGRGARTRVRAACWQSFGNADRAEAWVIGDAVTGMVVPVPGGAPLWLGLPVAPWGRVPANPSVSRP